MIMQSGSGYKLPEAQKEIILRMYRDGASVKEIYEKLNVAPTTVYKLIKDKRYVFCSKCDRLLKRDITVKELRHCYICGAELRRGKRWGAT